MTDESVVCAIIYILFCICIIFPPTEFISAGLTLNSLFSHWLGDESLNFVEYHLKRSVITIFVHSCLPFGFLAVLYFTPSPENYRIYFISSEWQLKLFLLVQVVSVLLPISAVIICFFHYRGDDWINHPIVKILRLYDAQNWRNVADSINTEFRRIDKFTVILGGVKRVTVTDSWIILTDHYSLKIARQADARLKLIGADKHELSHLSETQVQFVNIKVENIVKPIKPFNLRLNSRDYRDLRAKLQAPILMARNVVIHLTLDERFVEAFRHQAEENAPFEMAEAEKEALDNCIGCMQQRANVKLEKTCQDSMLLENDDQGRPIPNCRQCYCRPMWCLSCMGRWFASRQSGRRPETWLSGKSPCPTCRATFCVLDVSLVR